MVRHDLVNHNYSLSKITSSGTTPAIDLGGAVTFSFMALPVVTGTSTAGATLTFQKSNDPNVASDPDAGQWTNIASADTFESTPVAPIWLQVVDPEYQFVRAVYTTASGGLDASNHFLSRG